MKKTSLLLTMVFSLLLCSGLVFAGNAQIIEALGNGYVHNSADTLHIDLLHQVIATNNSISLAFSNIGQYDSLDGNWVSTSAGTITTANLSWRHTQLPAGEIVSETLTFGTPVTTMQSDNVIMTIYSYEAAPVTCTANIMFTNN